MNPLAWWVWTSGVALALINADGYVIGAIIGVVIIIGFSCRRNTIFTRALEAGLVIGAIIVVVRTGFYILVGFPDSSPVLVNLPRVNLPFFTNLHVLGPIHTLGLTHAATEGLRLGGLVVVFSTASALANPRQALRHLPSSLHHIGTAAVIAVTSIPHMVSSIARVRRARALRPPTRQREWLITPVLADALDHSLTLAGSMDSRGYARAKHSPRGVGAALIVALLAGTGGVYGLLSPNGNGWWMLIGSLTLAVIASVVASRAVKRTRYFPLTWTWRDVVITTSGVIVGVGALVGWSTWMVALAALVWAHRWDIPGAETNTVVNSNALNTKVAHD